MAIEGNTVGPMELDIQTDEYGNWSTEILNTLEPGVHTAVLQTSDGREQDVAFFVLQDEPSVISKVQNVVPPMFNIFILVLIILVLILGWNSIRLARKAEKSETDKKNMRYSKGAIIISLVAMVIALVIGLIVNKDNGSLSGWLSETEENVMVTVTGNVVDPLTEAGVEGVDLTVGKTSVHTSTSGNYTFTSIDKNNGIKITYPKLIRSLRYQIQDEANQTIYFNSDMYNLVINVINNESRGLYTENYKYTHNDLQALMSETDYVAARNNSGSIFGLDDLVDQELGIESVTVLSTWQNELYSVSFDNVVEITVVDDGMTQKIYVIYAEEGWRLIK